VTPAQLGIYINSIDADTVLTPSLFGGSIFAAQADGTVFRYDTTAGRFAASRQDYSSLEGAYGAVAGCCFVAGTHVMNQSLVTTQELEAAGGESSGVARVDGLLVRTASPAANQPGVIERVDLTSTYETSRVKLVESPVLAGNLFSPFTRTLAPLRNHQAIVSLSTSGLIVLPWNFYAPLHPPHIEAVVSTADGDSRIAVGEVVDILGSGFSNASFGDGAPPLPRVLGETCAELDGRMIPLALVSPDKIVAQIPFGAAGSSQLKVRGPGGISETVTLSVSAAAPSILYVATAGPLTDLPAVIRAKNGQPVTSSNPIHPNDDPCGSILRGWSPARSASTRWMFGYQEPYPSAGRSL